MPKKVKIKLPDITQLPSGSYHATVYDYTDETGHQHYRSFTDKDIAQVVKMVTDFKAEKKARDRSPTKKKKTVTVSDAVQSYINSRTQVLSPTTVTAYRKYAKTMLQTIMQLNAYELTQEDIQRAVSEDASHLSPKSVRNAVGLLSASLRAVRPDFAYHITLPQKQPRRVTVPEETDMVRLLAAARDTDLEIPVTLAALCAMRLSEICALRWSDVTIAPDCSRGTIRITHSLVHVPGSQLADTSGKATPVKRPHADGDTPGAWIEKGNKTTGSTRDLPIGRIVCEILARWKDRPNGNGEYITIPPYMVDRRYRVLAKSVLTTPCTFHQLRHYCASLMLAQGAPQKYVSNYLGHSTEHTTSQIYLHIMQSAQDSISAALDAHYTDTYSVLKQKS